MPPLTSSTVPPPIFAIGHESPTWGPGACTMLLNFDHVTVWPGLRLPWRVGGRIRIGHCVAPLWRPRPRPSPQSPH